MRRKSAPELQEAATLRRASMRPARDAQEKRQLEQRAHVAFIVLQ